MANSIIAGLPNFALAVAIFLLFYFIAKRCRWLVTSLTEKQNKAKNLGIILGKLAQTAVIVIEYKAVSSRVTWASSSEGEGEFSPH